jgi:hypothetical protein
MFKKGFLLTLIVGMVLALAAPGQAAVVYFDDLDASIHLITVPASYSGLQWDGHVSVISLGNYNESTGNTIAFPSPPNAAFNNGGYPTATITISGGLMNVVGAYFATWARNDAWSDFSTAFVTVSG